jgi:hypothetical protein
VLAPPLFQLLAVGNRVPKKHTQIDLNCKTKTERKLQMQMKLNFAIVCHKSRETFLLCARTHKQLQFEGGKLHLK